jgi:Fe-S cluster assembly protein SufD
MSGAGGLAMLNGNSGATDFEAIFTDRRARLPGADLGWLTELRESGINQFRRHGLPTPRMEAWKYTNLRALQKVTFAAPPAVSTQRPVGFDRAPSLLPSGEHVRRLVLTEGRFNPELSSIGDLPPGVTLEPLAQAIRRDPGGLQSYLGRIAHPVGQPMLALNTALMEDGAVLRVGRGAVLSEPVEVLHLGGLSDQAVAYHPRLLVLLEADSRAVLVEHFLGLGEQAYFANAATEIRVAEGARLDHIKVQGEGAEATHLASCHVWLDRQATFISFSLALGAQLSRNEVHVRLEGEGARCRVNGAYLMRGKQHCDNTTLIEHLKPDTSCREVFKGVLDDQSRGVFQGRIVVHRGADKTDGHQLCKTLLLSDRAEIDVKPELEIYADDVKCSHGATVGDIDEQALFYLRSRGIPEARARSLLIQAFLDEALDEVGIPALHEALLSRVAAWLGTG